MATSCYQSCYVGCRYFVKGPPDYYIGEKDLKKGVRDKFFWGVIVFEYNIVLYEPKIFVFGILDPDQNEFQVVWADSLLPYFESWSMAGDL